MSKIWGGRKFYLIIGVLSFSFLCKAEYFIGDLNNDCQINVADLVILAEQWLTTGPDADLNQDSIVNLEDYALFSANWKKKIREVIISEFLASNNSSIKDEDANTSDWVELYNMTPEPVSLLGWYLTDDADNLTKWSFPNIMIGGGDVLVIFASGQDRRNPASPLHTNFSLSANGEYLALVKPDGSTIAYEYKPNFPQQVTDISYGVAITGQNDMLIAGGAGCKYLIPNSEASLPLSWNAITLDDTAWQSAVLGVGYDTSTWGMTPENLALGKTATQTTDYSTSFLASNAVDGNLSTISHTAGSDTNATWWVNMGDDYYISQIILYNRSSNQSRLRDITVTIRDLLDTTDLFVSDLLNPENILGGPASITIDLGSPILGGIVKVHRTPDPDLSGIGTGTKQDDMNVLTLAEVDVEGSASLTNLYSTLIQTNLLNEIQNQNSSVFIRIPFSVVDKSKYDFMYFNVRYDDGFAVYLNGSLVAMRNAPAGLVWNAVATAEHSKPAAILYETINLTQYLNLLNDGNNVLAIHGLNLSSGDEDFLMDVQLTANEANCGPVGYLGQMTPGQVNGSQSFEMVADTKFSVNRGYYDMPFDVAISTDTVGATIYYTTDGSTPSSGHGNVYTAPIHIDKTTCLRAVAVKPGCLSTNVDTQTYIFLNDVIHQPENPEGFPTLWKSVAADYEMDPNIVDNPQYSAQMRDVLLSLPVISLVTDQGNLFDSTYGIYANSDQYAYDMADGTTKWEVPVSMEYFDPNSSKEIQVDCGLRIQGAYFRKAASTPKHSFRLLFKRDYGSAKLNFPFFDYDNDAANSFDTIILRAQGNDGYSWGSMGGKSQYVRDEFGRRVQMATGHASPHGTFVHLYINGLYWGLYNPTERPDSSFMASYYGGEKEDWDVFKHKLFELNEGTPDALNQMKALCQTSVAKGSVVITNAVYQQLQGNNPDGTRNPSYPDLLDMDNYIDYMLTNFWTGNQDWGFNDNNYWLGRLRVGDSAGFKFYCWDIEDTLDSPRSPLTFDNVNHVMSYDVTGMGLFHNRLVSNAEYRLSFADHAHKHLFNGGVMTMGPAVALYTPLANMVERAMIAESARWGNQHHTPSYTQANWITERDYILNTYFPQRTAIVLAQLKAKGLYPAVEAPTFNINGTYQHGGNVGNPAALTMEVPEIITYVSTEFVPEGAAVRAYVPSDNSLGLTWTSQSFTPGTGWTTGSTGTGVGYDCSPSAPYDVLIHTDVESLMYNLRTSVYCRIAFNVSNPADVNDLKLQIKYDDGFIAYLNGTEVCRSSNITNAVPPTAAGSHEAGTTFVEFDITAYKTLLTTGTNILAIHGINSSKASKDLLVLPKLVASVRTVVFPPVWYTTDGTDPRQFGGAVSPSASLYSGAVTLTKSRCVKARTLSTSQWSALNEATYSVGPVAESLRITELMYHPEGDPNAEYIELKNIGTQTINLNLVRFTKGVDFTFGPLDLAAGGFIVVVRNTAAFNAAHPGFTGTVAGVYTGSLNSAGEKIRLKDAIGTVIHEFTYQDTWYDMTDGEGFSLTIKNPAAGDLTLWNQKAGWRPSAMSGGSPGLDDSGIIPALGSVVINEVLAHSPAGQPDWIEFYNTTDQAIYLGGWFLSDSNANDPNRMKYRIGEEVVIPAGGYYVFYEDQHFGNPADPGCNIPFALSEGGDSVYLFSGDGETLTGYVEEETFDASETDVAFDRYYKASTDSYNFVAMSENTPGSANAYPKVGPIVIREIMYNPPAGGIYDKEEYEYIELRNIESYSVALQEYDIVQDIYVPWKITDGVEFTFPLEVTIPAGGTMVVVRNVTAFSVRYPSVPTNKIYGPYSGKLDNAGEKVDLVKPGDEEAGVRYYIRVDRVNYSDGSHPVGSDPWPAQADGLGMSLTRINDSLYGNDVANWQAASPTPGQ